MYIFYLALLSICSLVHFVENLIINHVSISMNAKFAPATKPTPQPHSIQKTKQQKTKQPKMGNYLMKAFKTLFTSTQEVNIVMVGLDGAGKTTVLYKLKTGDSVLSVPTVGFNIETLEYKNLKFNVWDVGGQDRIRPLWKHYYQNASGVIYVVDSNDPDRIEEAAEEMGKMLQEETLSSVPVLVLANKQDLPRATKVAVMTEQLGMGSIKDRKWYLQGCCGTSGDGLYEGLDWLSTAVSKN
jgi:ADP-ribosylation factor protein 1